jgi:[ribosomal protein S5]-alanine N-acetyltransferase
MMIWQSTKITVHNSGIDVEHLKLNPVIETARLRLEPQVKAHAKVMLTVLSDPKMYMFIPGDPPTDLVALEMRYEQLESRRSSDGLEYWLNWIVFTNNAAIGRVEASVHIDEARADVAYVFNPTAWGQGFAAEAMNAMLEHLQLDLRVKKFTANVDTRNEASIRLLKRLGFRQISLIEHADEFKGAVSDEFVFEKIVSA